jgi:RND superfamily putative drug exporter
VFARLGRFCYDRRRWIAVSWLVIFAVGLLSGGAVTKRLDTDQGSKSWESVQGYTRISDTAKYGDRILAVVDGRSVDDQRFRTAVTDARGRLLALRDVGRVVDPVTTPAPPLIATDRKAILLAVDLDRGLGDDRKLTATAAVEKELRAISAHADGVRVTIGGNSLLRREVKEQSNKDTQLGEFIAQPLTLLVMVVIFGGLVAAGVPFLGALASIAGGLLTLLGFSTFLDLDASVLSVTTVMGLGLSIDYALLLVSRFREERAGGLETRDAVERTIATAGRTITFSALTVATSLSGLFVFPSPIFRAIASAGVGVVLVALLVGLTLTPALLSLFSRRIKVKAAELTADGFFARMARGTRRHAVLVTIGLATLLITAGAPFLGANFQNSTAKLLPRSFESRAFAELLGDRFPGHRAAPITVVANTDQTTLQLWAMSLKGSEGVLGFGLAEQRADGLSTVDILPQPSYRDEKAADLVRRLRDDRPKFTTWVTGDAAVLVDFKHEVGARTPWALALVALATFVLLFTMTGSLLVPLKALVMNTLSLGASFGALVLIFQDGHLSNLLQFDSTGGLETWVPVLVFAFAFGLSMDYEVFLLARVKELYDSGLSNNEAVEVGLQRSGRIITSAALLVIIVFAGFASGKMLSIKELGVAMSIAVAVDATLVRCLLVPATMTLLGDANWWAPGPLRRLHDRFGISEAESAPAAVDATAPVGAAVH